MTAFKMPNEILIRGPHERRVSIGCFLKRKATHSASRQRKPAAVLQENMPHVSLVLQWPRRPVRGSRVRILRMQHQGPHLAELQAVTLVRTPSPSLGADTCNYLYVYVVFRGTLRVCYSLVAVASAALDMPVKTCPGLGIFKGGTHLLCILPVLKFMLAPQELALHAQHL
jgi:hypothetical protein